MRSLMLIGHPYLKAPHPNQSQHTDHQSIPNAEIQYVF